MTIRQRLARLALGACVAAVAIIVTSRGVGAQDAPGLQLLALPEGLAMVCHAVPADAGMPAAARALIQREFRFGRASDLSQPPGLSHAPVRTIAVAFDSGGRPVLVGDKVVSLLHGSEQVIATFGADSAVQGRHIVVPVDSAKLAAALAAGRLGEARAAVRSPVTRELTPEEAERVTALTSWLWLRRCGGA